MHVNIAVRTVVLKALVNVKVYHKEWRQSACKHCCKSHGTESMSDCQGVSEGMEAECM